MLQGGRERKPRLACSGLKAELQGKMQRAIKESCSVGGAGGRGNQEAVWSRQFSSVQFSRSVLSDCLQPHEPQYPRPPCPSPTPGDHPNPCPLSHWCHPTISSSVIPFSSLLQSFPASGSFPTSQFFVSGGQRIEVSASVLPMNVQD